MSTKFKAGDKVRYEIHETIPSNCHMLGKSLTFKWSEK